MVERIIVYLTEKILVTFFLNVLVHEMCYSNRFYRAMIKQYYSRYRGIREINRNLRYIEDKK